MPEVIIRSVSNTLLNELTGKENNFDLSMKKLELFIALQYVRGLYSKNHPLDFLYNETYDIPLFFENTSHCKIYCYLEIFAFWW